VAIAKHNECIPYYTPGDAISAYVTTAVTGKRFVKISGNRQAGPALNTSTTGGNVSINHATAAGRIFGVAKYDGAVGDIIPVEKTSGSIVPVTAEGAIAAFAEVEVGTAGKAVTKTSGVAVGYVVSAAADTEDAQVVLY
jgi:hypothetical protein